MGIGLPTLFPALLRKRTEIRIFLKFQRVLEEFCSLRCLRHFIAEGNVAEEDGGVFGEGNINAFLVRRHGGGGESVPKVYHQKIPEASGSTGSDSRVHDPYAAFLLYRRAVSVVWRHMERDVGRGLDQI